MLLHRKKLLSIYQRLFKALGPQHWWPAKTPFEVIVGAILTQNTSWVQVEKAIKNLKEQGLLSPERILKISLPELAQAIRPSGYFNQKAKRLKTFVAFLQRRFKGNLRIMAEEPMSPLRKELLELSGIGPETADSILLYAFHQPLFVVDAYTHRIFTRQGMIEEEVSYEELQGFFMDHLPLEAPLFNEYHALIVKEAKEFCRKKALCSECPISEGCLFGEGKN
ncbi:MAG: endonuclease III domain-containing protein [Deltaproteobacteria bacterium]|nr:endonuclease III domain-containing protein [Deltaproteobacteria bacterium]